jgi:hypothetical protein
MTHMTRPWSTWFLIVLLFIDAANTHAFAGPAIDRWNAELLRPYVPAVSMETDRRIAPEDGARGSDGVKAKLGTQYGATGLVRCGGAVGTAQLTLRSDVITTAAHVLIGADGQPRASCTFQSAAGGTAVAIDPASIKAGSRSPLSEPATRDWAVARLRQPIANAAPYGLAPAGSKPGAVFMFAGGNKRAEQMGAEQCNARGMLAASPQGVREFAIDCNAAPGSSGAALTAGHQIVGIYLGYRSTDPERAQAFSSTHYNFAITVEGPFRHAVLAAAGR